jgi:hypothetical protein
MRCFPAARGNGSHGRQSPGQNRLTAFRKSGLKARRNRDRTKGGERDSSLRVRRLYSARARSPFSQVNFRVAFARAGVSIAPGPMEPKSLCWLFWLCCFLSKGHAPHHRNRSLRRHRRGMPYHRRQEDRLLGVIGRAAWPQLTPAPPSPAMNSRRFIRSPHRRARAEWSAPRGRAPSRSSD